MVDASRISSPEVRALRDQLVDMQTKIERLEKNQRATGLGYSSIDDGTLWVRDSAGVNRVAIGRQVDGKFGWGAVNGEAAPRPNDPTLTSTTAGFNVAWNGNFAGIKPSDFTYVVAYASPAGDMFALDDSLIVGRLFGAGVIPVTALNGQPINPELGYWVRLVAYNTSGIPSEASFTVGPIQSSPVVATEILDGIVGELQLADDAVTAAKIAVGQINQSHLSFDIGDLESIATYAQAGAPTGDIRLGSLWIDTDAGNKFYRYDGGSWQPLTDADIATALAAAQAAQTAAANALTQAAGAEAAVDGKVEVFFQDSAPLGAEVGDLWINTSSNNTLSRWNGATWAVVADQRIATALANAATAQSTADGKIRAFYQATAPSSGVSVGDLWYNTGNGNAVARYNGTSWTPLPAGTAAIADNAITGSKVIANAIQSLHIAAEQIFASHIAAGTITGDKIQALSIVAGHIAANQIDTGHVKAGAITADKLSALLVLASQIIAGDPADWHLELGDPTTPILYWNNDETGFAVSRDPATGQANVYMSGRVEFGNGSQIEQDYLDLCEQESTGFQSPKIRQQRSWIDSGPTTSVTPRWTSATQPGSTLIMTVYAVASSGGSGAPAITAPAGWTLVRDVVFGTSKLLIYAMPNATASRTAEPFTGSLTPRWGFGMFEVSGLAAGTVIDVSSFNSGTGTLANSGTTAVTSLANELHLAVVASPTIGYSNGKNGQWTSPTNGFTKVMEADGFVGHGFAVATKTATSTAASSTALTINKSTAWLGLIATFRQRPADGIPKAPPTATTRLFTLRRGGKSTPHVIDDTSAVYPVGRMPYCTVRCSGSFSLAAMTDIWAQGAWSATEDPYGMVAISGSAGTYSNITVPIAGRYLIFYRTIFAANQDAVANAVCYIARNTRDRGQTIAADSRRFVRYGPGDHSPVQAMKPVTLGAGDILYWGNWSQIATQVLVNASSQYTEIGVQYMGPA